MLSMMHDRGMLPYTPPLRERQCIQPYSAQKAFHMLPSWLTFAHHLFVVGYVDFFQQFDGRICNYCSMQLCHLNARP